MKFYKSITKRMMAVAMTLMIAVGSFYVGGSEAKAATSTVSIAYRSTEFLAGEIWQFPFSPSVSDRLTFNGDMFITQEFSDNYMLYTGGLTYEELTDGMVKSIVTAANWVQFSWAGRTRSFATGAGFIIKAGAPISYKNTSGGVSYIAFDKDYLFTFGAATTTGRLNTLTVQAITNYNVPMTYDKIIGSQIAFKTNDTSFVSNVTATSFTGTVDLNGTNTQMKLIKSGNWMLVSADNMAAFNAAGKFKIPAGTVFVSGTTTFTAQNELYYELDTSGNWVVYDEPLNINYNIPMTFYGLNSAKTQLMFPHNDTTKFGTDIANGTAFTGSIKLDGVPTNVILIKSGNNLVTPTTAISTYNNASEFEIPEGTVFTYTTGNDTYTFTTTNALNYVQTTTGTWVVKPVKKTYETTLTHYTDSNYVNGLHATGRFFVFQYEQSSGIADATNGIPNGTKLTATVKINDLDKTITLSRSGNNFLSYNVETNPEYTDATKIVIPEGTIFKSADGGYEVTVTNEVQVVKNTSGIWGKEAQKYSTSLTYYVGSGYTDGLHGTGRFFVLPYDAESGIGDEATGIPNATKLTGTAKINGEEKQITLSRSGSNFLSYNVETNPEYTDATRLEIAEGTLFISSDGGYEVTITNTLKLLKNAEGTWALDDGWAEQEYNDIKISFESFDGRGFYLKAEIVAGPDKGKIIGTEAYGSWLSSSRGNIYLNGTEKMQVIYSPNGDKIYISGDYNLEELTSLTIKAGTLIIPTASAQNRRYMRVVNTLELEKESVYGRWGVKGVIQTPTKFCDVTLSVKKVRGLQATYSATIQGNSSKLLKDLYGNNTYVYGSVTIGDPDAGVYDNDNATFAIIDGTLVLVGIKIGLMDSIQLKKGTILWPSASSQTQMPIRLANTVTLTRNAEDEWVYTTASTGSGGITSPQTGDANTIMLYALVMVAMAGIATGAYYYEKRRRMED